MARAGLFVAADPGVRVGAVDAVLADIGDEQDIRESLSTFSAHMANLAAIVAAAGPRTLVLLDELGVGTDPGQPDGAVFPCCQADIAPVGDRATSARDILRGGALETLLQEFRTGDFRPICKTCTWNTRQPERALFPIKLG